MKAFANLYRSIDETNKTNEKVAAMARYFREAPPDDAAWTVHFLIGRRPKRAANSTRMQELAAHLAGIPPWLFGESYDAVGDLAETIALILPQFPGEKADKPLTYWVEERLLKMPGLSEDDQVRALAEDWIELDPSERFVYNKLITGAFRVGVSQELVVRAIAQVSGIPAPVIAHRLMGDWTPSALFYEGLLSEQSDDTDVSRPYPFCLAHSLEQALEGLGPIEEWHAEWKWDGIRAQLIRREGQSFVWSRGEELITERFPEMVDVCEALPNGTVIDGEILAWAEGKPQKFMALQRRIGRKLLSKKILQEVPAVIVAFDILEYAGEDLRERPYVERRRLLEELVDAVNTAPPDQLILGEAVDPRLASDDPDDSATDGLASTSRLLISSRVEASTWNELALKREESRNLNVEGLMLKRLDSPYLVGRKKGNWWKWKIEPLTVDAVLIYAQRGSGKRASLYTDYTFGVWDDDGKLVPFAKAYSGLTDEEIRRVDSWVRRNTKEKFGPVRTVEPELVMELAFEGIQVSNRHKSGLAVRFPRILRWRHDKKPPDADSLASVREMLKAI
ncbi:ATP-dependent DNA ligase [Fimbriimonas ginsengisoli]|uniref:DNA ligase (ATP) n=1 Tax=Fimbriimonas ginsengisoli Gsoil 348 TaxID=661478 RepID=A0A068NWH2_FIMGI|nr:ATP-dependent DNA ligase [Fimbriimonas ginsengisoli]AIE87095.1 ATP dependent DNA ligase [Fimbriimonas ginsengisoli Gsoil 348]